MPASRLTKNEVKALVASLHDMVAVLEDADPADKAAVYAELGISMTYHPDGGSSSRRSRRVVRCVSEGGLELMPVA